MTKFQIILVGTIAIGGVMASLVIQHGAQFKVRENDAALRQQDNQLTELAVERQRLSNLVVQANNSPITDQISELHRLRSQAEALRKQTDDLAKQREQNLRSQVTRAAWREESHPPEYNQQRWEISAGKIADSSALYLGSSDYAYHHQGRFPSSLDQIASYLRKEHRSLTGTNEFEIVYEGSLDELTNIPLRSVVLIRERQAWLAPSGKWARVYRLADGQPKIIESDDNFQSWEAEHIIPPPAAGQE